ncbi:phosphopantetheine-binding protein [Glycomyces tritici]|uniref:Phosphopantetheine-binding protein n=1 Tax=Glycomyces tritici TaxID=2665176 RepID=A0ABT7YWR3_9ACTN|nr:phosphopantetheine-binding protein [Glycomyces tritici]MDN3243084.1 phosphopantetheine-binding protein [Glycomyces tritici]
MNPDQIDRARALVARVLEVPPEDVADGADFRDDLDADSLQLAEIAAALEDELGVESDEPPASFAEVRELLAAEAGP